MEYFQNQAAQQLYLECIKELEPKATECFENEHEIERELKLLEREIAEHHKIVKKWLGLVKQLNQSVKELGDVENYCQMISQLL